MKLNYKKLIEKKEFLPFYVYDYETIKGQILKLKKHLPPNVKIFYSAKVNPNIAILQIMRKFDLGVQITSWGEFVAARRAGFNGGDVIFCGSIKNDNEFQEAIRNRVDLIGIESLSEWQRLDEIVKSFPQPRRQKILLRLDSSQFGVKSSLPRRQKVPGFGLSPNELKTILDNFPKLFSHFDLGIHIYQIRDIFDSKVLGGNVEQIFSITQNLERQFGLHFEVINIGGGFGSNPYSELPILDFSRQLQELICKYHFNEREIILELGRYFVNKAGSLVTEVIDLQENNGQQFVSVCGIINCLNRIFGSAEDTLRFRDDIRNYPMDILPTIKGCHSISSVIRGQLSSTGDILGRGPLCKFTIPMPKLGNLVVISGVGAYGITRSPLFFGSRPMAAEFLLINGKLELIRDKGKPEDFLKNQIIPEVLK